MIIQIDDILITTDILSEMLCCDLDACKGECCVEGDQIVKIHGPGSKHPTHVFAVDLPDSDPAQIAARPGLTQVLRGRKLRVLCAADLREHDLGGEGFLVQIHVLDDVLHQALAVGSVVDGEV